MPMNSTQVLLYPLRWKQTIRRDVVAMHLEAEARRAGARLNVPGIGNVFELPFELQVVRGRAEWNLANIPQDAIGCLSCQEKQPDDVGLQRDIVSGGLSLPESLFDEVWQRVRLGPEVESVIALETGPISGSRAVELVWDRAKDKFLFVMDVAITFVRNEKRSMG